MNDREALAKELAIISGKILYGCSNNGCIVAKREKGSIGTNGICQCKPNKISESLLFFASELENKREWND